MYYYLLKSGYISEVIQTFERNHLREKDNKEKDAWHPKLFLFEELCKVLDLVSEREYVANPSAYNKFESSIDDTTDSLILKIHDDVIKNAYMHKDVKHVALENDVIVNIWAIFDYILDIRKAFHAEGVRDLIVKNDNEFPTERKEITKMISLMKKGHTDKFQIRAFIEYPFLIDSTYHEILRSFITAFASKCDLLREKALSNVLGSIITRLTCEDSILFKQIKGIASCSSIDSSKVVECLKIQNEIQDVVQEIIPYLSNLEEEKKLSTEDHLKKIDLLTDRIDGLIDSEIESEVISYTGLYKDLIDILMIINNFTKGIEVVNQNRSEMFTKLKTTEMKGQNKINATKALLTSVYNFLQHYIKDNKKDDVKAFPVSNVWNYNTKLFLAYWDSKGFSGIQKVHAKLAYKCMTNFSISELIPKNLQVMRDVFLNIQKHLDTNDVAQRFGEKLKGRYPDFAQNRLLEYTYMMKFMTKAVLHTSTTEYYENESKPEQSKLELSDNEKIENFITEGNSKAIVKILKTWVKDGIRKSESVYLMKAIYFIHNTIEFVGDAEICDNTMVTIEALLELLSEIIQEDVIKNNQEVIDTLISLNTIQKLLKICSLSHTHMQNRFKFMALSFEIISKFARIDRKKTGEEIRRFFENSEISQVIIKQIYTSFEMLTIFLMERHDEVITDPTMSDYGRYIFSLFEFCKEICDDHNWIRDHLRSQDNSPIKYSILKVSIDLFRTAKRDLDNDFVAKVVIHCLRFIRVMIDDYHINNLKFVTKTRFIEQANSILRLGYYGEKEDYYNLDCKKINLIFEPKQRGGHNSSLHNEGGELEEKEEDKGEEIFAYSVPRDNRIINLLKYNMLLVLNLLYNEDNMQIFRTVIKDHYLLKNMNIQYTILKKRKNKKYTPELFENSNKTDNNFMIDIGFYCYYIYHQVFEESVREYNIIQERDDYRWYYRYIRVMNQFFFTITHCKNRNWMTLREDETVDKDNQEMAVRYFDKYSSHIEILVQETNQIATKYFYTKPAYLLLTQGKKDEFWRSANLDSAQTFCQSLIDAANSKTKHFEAKLSLISIPIIGIFVKYIKGFESRLSLLIIIINFFLILSITKDEYGRTNKVKCCGMSDTDTEILHYIIGILLLINLVIVAGVKVLFSFIKSIEKAKDEMEEKKAFGYSKKPLRKCGKQTMQILDIIGDFFYDFISSGQVWCIIPCLVFAILGLAFNFIWFTGCLLYPMVRNHEVMEIIQSVWIPRRRIILTFVLMCIIIYWFACVSYISYNEDFEKRLPGSEKSVWRIWVTIFNNWYKDGYGGFLVKGQHDPDEDITSTDTTGIGKYHPDRDRIIIEFLFFFIVATLIIEILGGIIIDTFVTLRENTDGIKDKQESQCYICGKSREELKDFAQHTKYTHNAWDYMNFIGYVNGIKYPVDRVEEYVQEQIKAGSIKWFPCFEEEDDSNMADMNTKISLLGIQTDSRLDRIESKVEDMHAMLVKITEHEDE